MTSIDKRLFPFVSYAFEELIDGRTMHGNRTVQSGLLDRGSLLNVLSCSGEISGCFIGSLLLLVAARRLFLSLPSSLVVV